MCIECYGGGCTHCTGDEGGGCALYPCEFCGKGGRSTLLFLSWGGVADGVAPYFCSIEHFRHDDSVVEVGCEAAWDTSALLAKVTYLGCIFFSFTEGIVGVFFKVEGLVEEDAEELVGCGRVDDVVYEV